MALFKVFRGNSANLPTSGDMMKDGYAFFCTDDGKFIINYMEDGVLKQKRINAGELDQIKLELASLSLSINEIEDLIAEIQGKLTIITFNIPDAIVMDEGFAEVNFVFGLPGMTRVNWGDGTIDTNTSHKYTQPGIYECKIHGLTVIDFDELTKTVCISSEINCIFSVGISYIEI